jgi:hypothetical protein
MKTALEIAVKYAAGNLSEFESLIFEAYHIACPFERGRLSVSYPEIHDAYNIWILEKGEGKVDEK